MPVIMENGEELTVGDAMAELMVERGLIFECDEDQGCAPDIYHLHPDKTWEEVDEVYTEGA